MIFSLLVASIILALFRKKKLYWICKNMGSVAAKEGAPLKRGVEYVHTGERLKHSKLRSTNLLKASSACSLYIVASLHSACRCF